MTLEQVLCCQIKLDASCLMRWVTDDEPDPAEWLNAGLTAELQQSFAA
jgi:hypothetical protein